MQSPTPPSVISIPNNRDDLIDQNIKRRMKQVSPVSLDSPTNINSLENMYKLIKLTRKNCYSGYTFL